MVGDKQQDSLELEASLAPAEAEVGAMAKADQNTKSSGLRHVSTKPSAQRRSDQNYQK